MVNLIDPATGEVVDAQARPDLVARVQAAAAVAAEAQAAAVQAREALAEAQETHAAAMGTLGLLLPVGQAPFPLSEGWTVVVEEPRRPPRRVRTNVVQEYAERLPDGLRPTRQPCPACKGEGWVPGYPRVADFDQAEGALHDAHLSAAMFLERPPTGAPRVKILPPGAVGE